MTATGCAEVVSASGWRRLPDLIRLSAIKVPTSDNAHQPSKNVITSGSPNIKNRVAMKNDKLSIRIYRPSRAFPEAEKRAA